MPPTGGGQQGQFAPGPQCKGAPKHCTFQLANTGGIAFRLKSACFTFYAADANITIILHGLLHSPLARALYVILFDLKQLIEDGILQVYM